MSANKATLYYFRGRGKAEIVRLCMAAAGVPFEQVNMTETEHFDNLKNENKLLFGQLPLVEFEDKRMVQSNATARFFARRANLLGDNEDEHLKIDILYEGTRDFLSFFMSYGFQGYETVLEKAKEKALPKYLPAFEKALVENGSNGYLVGSKLSLADIGLLECILTVDELMGSHELQPYTNIEKFLPKIKSISELANYLNGPQRHKKNDDEYVNEVRRVLRF